MNPRRRRHNRIARKRRNLRYWQFANGLKIQFTGPREVTVLSFPTDWLLQFIAYDCGFG